MRISRGNHCLPRCLGRFLSRPSDCLPVQCRTTEKNINCFFYLQKLINILRVAHYHHFRTEIWSLFNKVQLLFRKKSKPQGCEFFINLFLKSIYQRQKFQSLAVLKTHGQLIIFEIRKSLKKYFENFKKSWDFFTNFLRFFGSRSLQIRGLLFIGSKLDFLWIFENSLVLKG